MRLQFLGAAGYVTGSRTLIEYGDFRAYVDCGLYQGPRYITERNYLPLETDPRSIAAIFLTHAHIDHSGLIPRLYREGFRGRIYCTPPTASLLEIVLPDAAAIQEEEFAQLSRKERQRLGIEHPLFSESDARKCLTLVQPVPYNRNFRVGPFHLRYTWAGHILGAGHLNIWRKGFSVVFSGDIGPENAFFHKPLKRPQPAEHVVIEATYGDRVRSSEDYEKKLCAAVRYICERRGVLLMPAFAIGRAQTALYVLFRLMQDKKIPALPVILDSPMAVRATETYRRFRNELTREVVRSGFFRFLRSRQVRLIASAEESRQLSNLAGPCIIVSASGMCTGGRVLHHLLQRLGDTRNYVLFTGYAAEGTLAHAILSGVGRVKILGQDVPVRAMVAQIQSFSAHADQRGLVAWLRQLEPEKIRRVYINHGEDAARAELARELSFLPHATIELPRYESTYYLPCNS
ncbi:MAG: MBL fold metallo-hydrolase [Turneriella sp.]|nr:MBL fold metallo-hydrolase [Turneriella sp.]